MKHGLWCHINLAWMPKNQFVEHLTCKTPQRVHRFEKLADYTFCGKNEGINLIIIVAYFLGTHERCCTLAWNIDNISPVQKRGIFLSKAYTTAGCNNSYIMYDVDLSANAKIMNTGMDWISIPYLKKDWISFLYISKRTELDSFPKLDNYIKVIQIQLNHHQLI